ncbi:hypothetical protein LXL04_023873 [Taraxacum kok-saghyz]
MSRKRTIDYFFKPVHDPQVHSVADNIGEVEDEPIYVEPAEIREVEEEPINTEPEEIGMSNLRDVKLDSLIRDPGERPSILSYPINQRDEIRRLYIKLGPYQLEKSKYPSRLCGPNDYMRSFQQVWFKNFWWLEYSEKKDAAFCFPCYLFNKKPIGKVGSDTFTITGFNKWKKVNCGKDCAFIVHEGKSPSSAHNFSVRCYKDLKNQLCHIENMIEKQTNQQVMNNRLRLKVSIEAIKWLTFQACALRGHDEPATILFSSSSPPSLTSCYAFYNCYKY